MPTVGDPLYDRDSSCFLMVPYSNRIENGEFSFQGKTYRLDHPEAHAIHGDVRHRPWALVEATTERALLELDSRQHDRMNWPWPFVVRVEYLVSGSTFVSNLTLLNIAHEPMPAGLGWHPFFNRRLTGRINDVRLCFKTDNIYPDANQNRIPSGPPRALIPDEDFSSQKMLLDDREIDACYRGYDGGGYIYWPGARLRIDFDCSPSCSHLIVFNPPSRSYFAVEPVTNANNGVNLLAAGDTDCGLKVVEPGERLEARFQLSVVRNE